MDMFFNQQNPLARTVKYFSILVGLTFLATSCGRPKHKRIYVDFKQPRCEVVASEETKNCGNTPEQVIPQATEQELAEQKRIYLQDCKQFEEEGEAQFLDEGQSCEEYVDQFMKQFSSDDA